MRTPRGVQDKIVTLAASMSTELNAVGANFCDMHQRLNGLSPDQASMLAILAHAFSLHRLLTYPGLKPDAREALGRIALEIMQQPADKRLKQ